MRIMVSLNQRVQLLGYEGALRVTPQPLVRPVDTSTVNRPIDCWSQPGGICLPGANDPVIDVKDDAIQILTNEVMYQTLHAYRVSFTFKKVNGEWTFAIPSPVAGADFQDLDTPMVLGAVTQFRHYLIGLLCNNPNPANVLAMMNRYDVGSRFKWDMAWALLGNELPPTPNKYMRFSEQWKRFTAALDALENSVPISMYNPGGGIAGTLDPGQLGGGANGRHLGYIVREALDTIELVGNIASAIIDLYCRIDLSVNPAQEAKKQEAVTKLLALKRELYHRFNDLRPALDEMGRQATRTLGRPVSFYPPGNFPRN